MRYYLDTEFDETAERLFLISLALRAEDGRELYLISTSFSRELCNPWIKANVLPRLVTDSTTSAIALPIEEFKIKIEEFVGLDPDSEFWGWVSAYDWVLFCRLWGRMMDIPSSYPYVCNDLRALTQIILQSEDLHKMADEVPKGADAHNALVDARWIEKVHEWFTAQTARGHLDHVVLE